jgi:hypothetical protein
MRKILLLVIALFVWGWSPVRADEIYTFVVKKQEEKAKNRWSLSDWLETRDKMRLMDLWLAIHSPSPYEFFLSGSYVIPSASGAPKGADLAFAAFATIFGLETRYTTQVGTPASDGRFEGLFDLRIFGFHDQSTNITFQTGLKRDSQGAESYRNALIGGRMDIYLARYFGIGGLYHHYFDSTPVSAGIFGGNRYEGQAFIDFQFLRVFGTYFSESTTLTNAAASSSSTNNGVNLGIKLYF